MSKLMLPVFLFLLSCGQKDLESENVSKCVPESCEASGCYEIQASYIEEELCLSDKILCTEDIYFNLTQGLEATHYYIYEDQNGGCWASLSVKYPSSFTQVTSQNNKNCGKYIDLPTEEAIKLTKPCRE